MSSFFTDDGAPARGRKVCLATTAYENPDASYTYAIQRSREVLHAAEIPTAYFLLSGNCHVDDARNRIVQEFLLSDCTDLVFLDADVSWTPESLLRLCQHDADVVGGVYPFRREGRREDMPVRMIEDVVLPDERGLLRVDGMPTGFMRIRRWVLEKLTARSEAFWGRDDRRGKIPLIFERTFDGEKRWGGDLHFCNRCRDELGVDLFVDYEVRLGHTAKTILRDSLGATLRRNADLTLEHVADRVRAGTWTLDDLTEARQYVNNNYTPLEDVLAVAIRMAQQADGPIVETGSGLTSVLMAAATEQTVWCIEHSPRWAYATQEWMALAGCENFQVCIYPIWQDWYSPKVLDALPEHFALGLNDGPPRKCGNRARFFEYLGDRVDTILCDEADDTQYRDWIAQWADQRGYEFVYVPPRAALLTQKAAKAA